MSGLRWKPLYKNSFCEYAIGDEYVIFRGSKTGQAIRIPIDNMREVVKNLSGTIPPIKIASRKSKSRYLQEWCCKKISKLIGIAYGKDKLIQSRPMGQSGPDVVLVGEALDRFPWTVECKSAEQWNIIAAIRQVMSNLYKGTSWLLILKNKRISRPIAVIDGERFFDLLKGQDKWKENPTKSEK